MGRAGQAANTWRPLAARRGGPVRPRATGSRAVGLLVAALTLAAGVVGVRAEAAGMSDARTQEAIALMRGFAERTGLGPQGPARRYLWTDAFAVCNLLGLARATGDDGLRALAERLVGQVHHTLGRHRGDDGRRGWISGLGEEEGEAHPTRGGLRIGKPLPERGPGEPFDELLEWDRDGQYFHYLTKWMHALDRMARAMGELGFNRWARELAQVAHGAFSHGPPGRPRRMYWKLTIDLIRPLVPAMGQHDPLDGYVTFLQLRATAARLPAGSSGPALVEETGQFAAMLDRGAWASADPLGLGGLLGDAHRLLQLSEQGAPVEPGLVEDLLAVALAGVGHYARSGDLDLPAGQRLAFRELGLAIGLRALQRMQAAVAREPPPAAASAGVRARLQALARFASLGAAIESFWGAPGHRRGRTWSEHRDINEVMLATTLAPDGYLVLVPAERQR